MSDGGELGKKKLNWGATEAKAKRVAGAATVGTAPSGLLLGGWHFLCKVASFFRGHCQGGYSCEVLAFSTSWGRVSCFCR